MYNYAFWSCEVFACPHSDKVFIHTRDKRLVPYGSNHFGELGVANKLPVDSYRSIDADLVAV